MKATAKLLVTALAVGGAMLAAEAQAQDSPVSRGARGTNAMPRSAPAPSNNAAGVDHARHGGRGSPGTDGHHGSGHHGHHGHHHRHWGGYRHWSPRWSFYFGVPVLWGGGYWGGYWGAPYWYDGYPGRTLVYREVERDPSFSDHRIGPATTEVPRGEDRPAQGPLYMNYCESAKAYYPKVTTCPEGWKLAKPTE